MIRIGIMTFLHNDNYGSILQALALQAAVGEMGYEAEHIDYRPSRAEKVRNLLTSGNSPALIWEGMRKRGVRSYGSTSALHEQFLRERFALSEPCRDGAALARAAERYDLLLCGSDQIWSPVWLNPAYFLDFTDKPRIAYAASLGVKELPGAAKGRRIAGLVKPFAAVSVREEEGAALLETLTGARPAVMPDPVMLRAPEQWRALAKPAGREPYLLCYFIGDRPDYWQQAEALAKPSGQREPYLVCYFIGDQESYWRETKALSERMNLPALAVPKTEGAYRSGLPVIENVSPDVWLGLMDGAAHVITDSFHASAFSCLLNRPFTALRRYREDDPESKNSRVDQLLRLLALTDTANPDWDDVNARLARERARGLAWLEEAIGGAI